MKARDVPMCFFPVGRVDRFAGVRHCLQAPLCHRCDWSCGKISYRLVIFLRVEHSWMNRNDQQTKRSPKINRKKQDANCPSRAHPNKPSRPSKFGLINDDHGCMWWRTSRSGMDWATFHGRQHDRVQKKLHTKCLGKNGCIEGSASVTTVSGSIGCQ